MLKERTKNMIVKDYLDGEVQAVISEKQEVHIERERYAKLSETERTLHEDKKCHDQAVREFQEMTEKLF